MDNKLAESKIQVKTMGELGDTLCWSPGKEPVVPRFKKIFGEEEYAITQIIQEHSPNEGKILTYILSELLLRLGPKNFEEMKEIQRITALREMPQGAVFHLWALNRKFQLPKDVGWFLDFRVVQCPHCKVTEEDYLFPLDDLEIGCAAPGADLSWTSTLPEPVEIAGKPYSKFRGRPFSWLAVEEMFDRSIGHTETQAKIYHSDLIPVDNQELMIHEGVKLSKANQLYLDQEITKNNIGPKTQQPLVCGSCKKKFFHLFDWRYDPFYFVNFSKVSALSALKNSGGTSSASPTAGPA